MTLQLGNSWPIIRGIPVIEADDALSQKLIDRLESEGFKAQAVKNRAQASVILRSLRFDAILSEVRLPDGDGEQIYREALPFIGSTPIIFMTASANVDQAVRLLKAGAADYVKKDRDISPLIARLQQVISERAASKGKRWPEPIAISAGMIDLEVLSGPACRDQRQRAHSRRGRLRKGDRCPLHAWAFRPRHGTVRGRPLRRPGRT